MHRWGHMQKWTLKFSAIYRKLEKNRPSGSVMTDLLPDAKKAFWEQEGRQFSFERAWTVVKDSPKWNDFSEGSAGPVLAPPPSTPGPQSDAALNTSQASPPIDIGSESSWKRPLGVHSTKRAMKAEHYNAKKIKILSSRSNDYRERTRAMKKTNDIRQEIARAEVNQTNMEIMSKKIEDLPDEASREFLKLQKELILDDMRQQVEAKRKLTAEKNKQYDQSASSQLAHDSHSETDKNEGSDSDGSYGDLEIDPILDTL